MFLRVLASGLEFAAGFFWIRISAQFLSPAVLHPMQAEGLGFRV